MQELIAVHVQHVPLVLTRTLLVQRTVKLVPLAMVHLHQEQQSALGVLEDSIAMMISLSVVSIQAYIPWPGIETRLK